MAVLPPESIHAPSKNDGNSGKSGKTLNAADRKKEPIHSVSRVEKQCPHPRCCKSCKNMFNNADRLNSLTQYTIIVYDKR
jgi:hypothetical protein